MNTALSRTLLIGAIGAGMTLMTAAPSTARTVSAPGGASGVAMPADPACDAGWAVKIQRKTKYRKSTGERDELINSTSRPVQRTYTLTRQSATKWNVNAEVSASFKAWIFAEVNVKVGASLEKSSSITNTQSDTVTVRPRSTLQVTRGFRKLKVFGNMYYTWSNCAVGRYKSFSLTAPYSKYVAYKEVRHRR